MDPSLALQLLSIGVSGIKGKSRHGSLLLQELWRRHVEIREGRLSRSIAWTLLDLTNTKHKRSLLTPDEIKDRNRLLMWCLETLSLDLRSLSHREVRIDAGICGIAQMDNVNLSPVASDYCPVLAHHCHPKYTTDFCYRYLLLDAMELDTEIW